MERWQKTILFIVLFVILADELAYYWWRKIHPESEWNGALGKNPLQSWEQEITSDVANGFRPGGGNTRGAAW